MATPVPVPVLGLSGCPRAQIRGLSWCQGTNPGALPVPQDTNPVYPTTAGLGEGEGAGLGWGFAAI